MKKNKGYFKITNQLILANWKDIYIIFKVFRPTHIEFRHWENDIWYYYGESELFEEVIECEEIPQYNIIFTYTESNTTFIFERV